MALAGSSESAANWEEDGREVVPRVFVQGLREPADVTHQRREEGGVSVQDGDGHGGCRRGVAPPISWLVRSGFFVLPRTNFPGAHVGRGNR